MQTTYKFTEEHEWVKIEGDIATVGISSHATEELGEIVYVDLPKVGAEFEQMSEFGSVESVKTLSSLFIPLSGTITEINEKAIKEPALLNESPYDEGWLIKLRIADENEIDDLMNHSEYQQFLETL